MYKKGKNLKLMDEKSVFIGDGVVIGENVTIYENNRIDGKTVIGDNCVLLPNNYVVDAVLGKNVTLHCSVVESAEVGDGTAVGPYARLRPKAKIGANAKIGNFVEIKNAVVGDGTKVSHLAYVGDCEIGKGCNVGCGVIFVNYDGKTKSRSVVGDNCFIGSNCNVIAPVTIAKNSYVCAGTTVTADVAEGGFVIGRVRQEIKDGRAKDFLKEIW